MSFEKSEDNRLPATATKSALGRLLQFDPKMKTPSLKLVLGFWIVTNLLLFLWWRIEISQRWLPGPWVYAGLAIFVIAGLAPLPIVFLLRRNFNNTVVLGLLVSCCLAASTTAHEANLLREQMQISLDHERSFASTEMVEGIMRPLISVVVDTYVRVMGDDRKGSTYRTHIAINYMFGSLTFLAVFSLGTLLLSPTSTWLCLFSFAFYAQIAPFVGRMGAVFIAGGLFWQLFLLVSQRYSAAVISGIIISFARTDAVFASAFAILSLAAFERRWPTAKEWTIFGSLILISIAVPKILIWMHPHPNFSSFLVTHGDYFAKLLGNLWGTKLFVAIASPMLTILLVLTPSITRTTAIVLPAGLVHIGIVFVIADFSETRLLIPALGALVFVGSEVLGKRLEREAALDRN